MLKYASAKIMTAVMAPQDAGRRELRRFSHKHHFSYEVRPGYLYVRSRAISSRCNDNFDEFPAEELEKAYRTFIGKPVFINHNNEDHKRARGVIIDAVLHKDSNRDGTPDYWVEVLQEIDALRFPRLAAEILNKNIARTSMGTDVAYSLCSACGNRATTPAEYCSHIPASKGMMLYRTTASGKKIGEVIRETCYGLKFFENSLLVEPPADPTAHFTGVDDRGLKMVAGANGDLPEGLTFVHRDRGDSHVVEAIHPEDGSIGQLSWYKRPRPGPKGGYCATCNEHAETGSHKHPAGEVDGIEVDRDYRRQGVASALWNHAQSLGVRPQPKHSPSQTDAGTAWAGHVSSRVASIDDDDDYETGGDNGAGHWRQRDPGGADCAVCGYPVTYNIPQRRPLDAGWGHSDSMKRDHPAIPSDGRESGAEWERTTRNRENGRKVVDQHMQTAFDRRTFDEMTRGLDSKGGRRTLTDLFAEAVNQEGGELPAFPWDKAPKINLPMTQKGWDDPRRQQVYDAKGERDSKGPQPPGPYQGLIDKLPDYATQKLTNPHDIDADTAARTSITPDKYPGDKKEQWARHRWDNVKWPSWTDHTGRPSTPTEIASSKRNIRTRWSKTWKRPLACEHNSCPPWEHEGDPQRPTHRLFEGRRKMAYGETKAPQDVDTLREDACPVCGDRDAFDGATCQVCGYVAPPAMFRDPDLEKAKQMDLRKDIAEFQDPANPNQLGPDGQPVQNPADPSALDENGMPVNPDGADQQQQPGTLPGEIQAEVQPGGDPMGGGAPMDAGGLGPDGQPLQDPQELGAPVDPAMLGPDGQPLPQPGQQQMIGPDGTPIGPQALPPEALDPDGQPFTPGPDMPQGPGGPQAPEGPQGPAGPGELGQDGQVPNDGQIPNPDAGQGVPGTPGDGVPDLTCPACGFTADATGPVSVDMDTANQPMEGVATPDGVQAGDVCPNCGSAQLMSPAEEQGEVPPPMPAQI